jgi:hypothetical protein
LLFFLLFGLASVSPVLGADTGATVTGLVTDPMGRTVAGTTIQLTNVNTGVTYKTESNEDGIYRLGSLLPGVYRANVAKDGFKSIVKGEIELHVQDVVSINFALEVGSVMETVTVEAGVPQVETVSPTVGGTVTGAPIQNLPLNGRNVLDLALTEPGVTPAAGSPLGGLCGNKCSGSVSVSGGRDNSVTYLLDGGDNTSVTYGIAVISPNPDTIAEFRILNNNYTAEYGRSAGGVVSVITKSGSNRFHGSLFDYLRNDAFNANTYFDNAAGLPRPVLKRNQFGGTIGGPIVKGRAFFFFGYQGQRQNSVTVGSEVTTFTPAELNGDFSHSVNGGPDPNVAKFLESHDYFQASPTLRAEAIIDPTKINSVAQAYIKNNLIPTTASGLIVPNGTATDDRDEFTAKLDFNVSPNDKLTLSLATNHNPVTFPFLPGLTPNVPGFPGRNLFDSYFASVAYAKTFSTNVLNEFRMTVQYLGVSLDFPGRQLPGPAAMGVNVTPDDITGPPEIILSASNLQLGFSENGPAKYGDTTYNYADTFTWVRGRHTWKAGGSLAVVQNNAYFDFAVDGQFYFYGPTGFGSGNDRADFLLGAANQYMQYPKGLSAVRSHEYAGFVQDEWRTTSNLVLTLGVRYEYNSPKWDPLGRNYMIMPGLQSRRYPLAPLGLVFPGDPGAPRGVTFPDRNNWAPRFGFAWDPSGKGKTSIRGGVGLFYDVLLGQDNQNQNGTPPFFSAAFIPCLNQTCQPIGPNSGPLPYLSDPFGASGTKNPFPSSSLPPPQNFNFATEGLLPFGPSSVFIDPHMVTPYTYQYNLSIQQQLNSSVAAEVGYIGSSSHKLEAVYDRDPFVLGTSTYLLNTEPGLQIPNAFAEMPYSFGNVANAHYNGLLASLTKRLSDWHSMGPTFFTLSYTWSHNIDDADGYARNSQQVPYYNHSQFRASADSDIRSRLVFSGGWELPFAHLWASGPKRLTGGWNLYPIAFVQSGLPIDVNAGLFVNGTPGPSGAGDENLVRPDWVGGSPQSLDPHPVRTFTVNGTPITGHFAFDPTDLVVPPCYTNGTACPAFTYGTLSRNFFRGPSQFNFDLALEKDTQLTERLALAFRAEFFNILNHTEWQSPISSMSVYSPQLGQITSTYDPRIGQMALRLIF